MAHDGGLDRFLDWRQVRAVTGLGRTTAWRMRQTGDFPEPVPISPGRKAWRERDIVAWNESRGAIIPTPPARPSPAPAPVSSQPPRTPTPEPAPGPTVQALERQSAPPPPRRRTSRIAEGQLGFDF